MICQVCGGPSSELCQKLGKHLHGRLWELYQTYPKYKALWESQAPGAKEVKAVAVAPFRPPARPPVRKPCGCGKKLKPV